MAVQAGRGFPVDGRVEHPAAGRCGLAGQNEQTGRVAADAVADVGEGLQMLIGGQFPERALCSRVDPAAELAERGVGVDGDDAVVLTELGEQMLAETVVLPTPPLPITPTLKWPRSGPRIVFSNSAIRRSSGEGPRLIRPNVAVYSARRQPRPGAGLRGGTRSSPRISSA